VTNNSETMSDNSESDTFLAILVGDLIRDNPVYHVFIVAHFSGCQKPGYAQLPVHAE
jgi:hypothetical protein